MRITEIRSAGLRNGTPKGGWANEMRPEDCVHTLVAVLTDEGLTGWGSSFTNDDLVRAALHVLEPLYSGENALEPERVSEKLHENTFWLGRGGSITHTISGIDIALWDILGKATGQPVGRLLGGRYRERVRPYASLLMHEPAAWPSNCCRSAAQGFRAFKIGWGPFGRRSCAWTRRSSARRARRWGRTSLLMVDAGAATPSGRRATSGRCARPRMLADYDVSWFEEPLKPDALETTCCCGQCARCRLPAARCSPRGRRSRPGSSRGPFDIVQPDVTKVGGISEERRIAWMAQEHGVRFIPHGWNTALGAGRRPAAGLGLPKHRPGGVPHRLALHR